MNNSTHSERNKSESAWITRDPIEQSTGVYVPDDSTSQ